MIAKWSTPCYACGETIVAGRDEIVETTEEHARIWVHAECPEPRTAAVCPGCFLERPCPCEDEQ